MDVHSTRQQLFANELKVLRRNFSTTGTTSFLPIYLQTLMSGEKLSFNLYVKVSANDQQEVTFLPFLEAEEVLEPSWVEVLDKLGVDRFYFRRRDLERVIAYLNNHLLLFDSQKGRNHSKEKLLVLVEHLNFSLYRAFNSPHLGRFIHLAQTQVERLVQLLQKDIASLKLVWELLYRNYSLYNHSLNVCLLGIGLMLFSHKSRYDSLIVGLACLFHDLGLTRVPEELRYHRDSWDGEEWETIKKHPQLGYQMLKECESIPPEVLQLVLEHHENADGSGYPRGLSLNQQHPWTRIIRLVDAYDGLTGHRPNQQPLAPFAALKSLQNQVSPKGPRFDPRTLKNFIRFLALP
ncbi:MAG: HD domain-containing protein [Deltaproteobacteria bacterium]|nr:HD domain-containing protein [Deltaproteobacteria bacterium]MBI4795168.1 HD domain-containing protein [Deltaproteobacteria bacterium]